MNNNKQYIPNRILLQLGFLAFILIVFGIIVKNTFVFIPGILGALCIYVLLYNPLDWLITKKKWKIGVSVVSLIIVSAVAIIIPLYILIYTLTNKVITIINDKDKIEAKVDKFVEILHHKFNFDLLSEGNIAKIAQYGSNFLQSLLNASADMFIQIGVAFLLAYFMLMNYKTLNDGFYKYAPFKTTTLEEMNNDLKKLIISNAVGVPVTAIGQSIIAYIGYLIFGVESAFTWFIVTVFAAMLPVVGTAIVYIPIVIYLITVGHTTEGIGLLIYCIVFVGSSDNVIRFFLQKKIANVHPLVTIFGVVIGLNLFGFIGIVFGPILFSFFIWLIKLYNSEFVNPSNNIAKNEDVENDQTTDNQ